MNLYLIGYRGSGKTTVGPLVAELLGWTWQDTDEQVELLAGCSVAEIFREYGERHFREWETTVIEALSKQANLVVSTGGGAPMSQHNRHLMATTGRVIWLKANAEVLWSRIDVDQNSELQRPKLTAHGGLEEVQHVLAKRTAIYAASADYTINVESLSPEQIAEQIANWWDPVDN